VFLFGHEKSKLVFPNYDPEGGERTAKEIREIGGSAIFQATDVSNPKDAEAIVAKAVETW
jgi:hypothetical protein